MAPHRVARVIVVAPIALREVCGTADARAAPAPAVLGDVSAAA
ncbi:MAG: hypothetical protein RID81_45845 [Sandaracinaceae bacterium]